jgi:ubiquinone/menaquinone biosynthesis C-methylase UbiE
MYVGISRDGRYKPEDLLEGARIVEKYIKVTSAKNILELATGRGATSAYLAKIFSNIIFEGIDLSEGQLHYAYKKAKSLNNYHPVKGDYHDLSRYKSESFDIVFEIEALCYSQDKEKVFKEVKRVLKKGGVFILLDGYLKTPREKLSKNELQATQITEKGMAVPAFEVYQDVINKAKKAGFTLLEDEDVSKYILPTLKRFELLASFALILPIAAKLAVKILPQLFTYNTISGYLLPEFIKLNFGGYYITVLKKSQ